MEFELEQAKDILRRTPATLEALLRGLPAEWIGSNEGPDTWSPLDVLGHLIHGEEEDWIPRAKIILQHGEASTFEPFDRFAYLERESTKGKSLADLLATFETLRAKNLAALDEMDLDNDNRLALLGTHPEFGPHRSNRPRACETIRHCRGPMEGIPLSSKMNRWPGSN